MLFVGLQYIFQVSKRQSCFFVTRKCETHSSEFIVDGTYWPPIIRSDLPEEDKPFLIHDLFQPKASGNRAISPFWKRGGLLDHSITPLGS